MDETNRRPVSRRGSLPLCLSAGVLSLLVLLQLPIWPEASADMATKDGGFAGMVTMGGNRDIFVIVNDRTEDLLVYGVEPDGRVQLFQRANLARLFTDARRQAIGAP